MFRMTSSQSQKEKHQETLASGIMFCDTELIVTKIWSEVKYGNCDPWILKMIHENNYGLFLLCDIDIPWAFDPQREHPHYRKELFDLYFNELTSRHFPFRVVSGLGGSRLENAIRIMEELLIV
jgi:nicotinamide riboside kinase